MAGLNKLTTTGIAALCKRKEVGKHADGGGLYLQITDAGGCYWRYKYRIDGKEKLAAFGTFPEVSLAEAREKHIAARKQVGSDLDPQNEKRKVKIAKEVERAERVPFREVAQDWFDAMIPTGASASTIDRNKRAIRLMNEEFGDKAIVDVTVADLARVLVKREAAGTFSSRERDQLTAIKIGGFAVGRGLLKTNPFRDVKFAEAFTSPGSTWTPRPAITEPAGFGKLLRAIDRNPDETEVARLSLRILTLTAVRPGELAQARWDNIRWNDSKMIVPAALLKQRTQRKKAKDVRANKDFEVPLSRQAIVELRKLQKLTGKGVYLFPARCTKVSRNPHIRTATINNILQRMGYQAEHCAHGFRSSFSTIMNAERVQVGDRKALRWPYQDALIEVQLDHNDSSTKAVYDRGGQWEDRCEVMQVWADLVDEMRNPPARLSLVA